MHFKRRGVHEKARADELLVFAVLAQHVAHVLAEETFDALSKLLYAFYIRLLHTPGAVGRIGRTRPEFFDRLLDREIPGHVGDEIADYGEGVHRLQKEWPLQN